MFGCLQSFEIQMCPFLISFRLSEFFLWYKTPRPIEFEFLTKLEASLENTNVKVNWSICTLFGQVFKLLPKKILCVLKSFFQSFVL